MTRRPRTIAPLIGLLALVVAGCGGQAAAPAPAPTGTPAPPTATLAPTVAPTATPVPTPPTAAELEAGALVDIGGRRLFITCANMAAPGPAVIFEAGLAGDHTTWEQVLPSAAGLARACSYDRAGLGASDPGPTPRDAAAAAADLAALLRSAAVPGPYILVAHSFGGLFARRFAADNPGAVAGMILVDAVHEDWWREALAALPPETEGESERLRGFRRFLSEEVADPARNAEGVDIPAAAEQARVAGDLGSRPLIVLVAGVPDVLAPGLPPEVEQRLVGLLQRELPQAMAALSTDSTQIVVPDSGHNIPRQRPDMVVLAVQAVLAAVQQ